MVEVELESVTKTFEETVAMDEVSLVANEGEIFTLLGPSGCGKSTTLRAIAGFNLPDKGIIRFGGTEVTYDPPQKRNTGMVFQNYALWPHLSVFRNVEYGLRIRKVPKEERRKRVMDTLALVQMDQLAERNPNKLSGGQQQRVAVARALVINPDVLLLDEPLSNLDAKLRLETRKEIRSIVRSLGLTAIFVTHDQSEALSISNNIAVMNAGRIEQIGNPRTIYEEPENFFVSSFIGEATGLDAMVENIDKNTALLSLENEKIKLTTAYHRHLQVQEHCKLALRPERIQVSTSRPSQSENVFEAEISVVLYLGEFERLELVLAGGTELVVHRDRPIPPMNEGDNVFVYLRPEDVLALGA
ncbi:MAG: ABC transporter ATP-binding protein [Candidatus Hodarchaeales archaeon]|jgi:ABC-type Fe3+/spermidine/putrescine transport system ATPase subunit